MQQFIALAISSAGIGAGIFIGLLIGLNVRARKGNTKDLIAGSVFVTALVAGLAAMAVTMLMKFLWS